LDAALYIYIYVYLYIIYVRCTYIYIYTYIYIDINICMHAYLQIQPFRALLHESAHRITLTFHISCDLQYPAYIFSFKYLFLIHSCIQHSTASVGDNLTPSEISMRIHLLAVGLSARSCNTCTALNYVRGSFVLVDVREYTAASKFTCCQ